MAVRQASEKRVKKGKQHDAKSTIKNMYKIKCITLISLHENGSASPKKTVEFFFFLPSACSLSSLYFLKENMVLNCYTRAVKPKHS